MGCRAVLGLAEAGGIPAAGKAIHQYLKPAERALGNAVNQAGVSLGMILAPPVATYLAVRSGWRASFVVTGVLGLVWIPVWNWTARRAHTAPDAPIEPGGGVELLRDRRLWAFVAGNALSMVGYSLWSNWTTLYLVEAQHLTLVQAAWYAWIPPVFAAAGGLAGGWLSFRFVGRGVAPLAARFRVCLLASALSLVTVSGPAHAHSSVGFRGDLAERFRGIGLQREYVHDAAGRFWRQSRGLRRLHPGGIVRRGPGGSLAALWKSD